MPAAMSTLQISFFLIANLVASLSSISGAMNVSFAIFILCVTPTVFAQDERVDNTILNRHQSPPLMVVLGRRDHLIHAQIYQPRDSPSPNEDIETVVCSALQRSLQEALSNNSTKATANVQLLLRRACPSGGGGDGTVVDLRPFQSLPQRLDDDGDFPYIPLATWTHAIQVPTMTGVVLPPPPTRGLGDDDHWNIFVWDDALRQGTWWDNHASRTTAPSHFSSFMSHVISPYSGSVKKEKEDPVHLDGQLSETGGMHRKLHQTLRLRLPRQYPNATVVANILILLPPDLFINVEDAVEVSSRRPIMTHRILDAPPGRVIDQEEPSFVSPAHGVMLQIEFTLDQHQQQDATAIVEWDLLLHMRYPKPLEQADFSLVSLLTPTIWSLAVIQEESVLATIPCPFTMPSTSPQYTWVAVGRTGDLVPVMAVTLIAALVGSFVMLRELNKTARILQQR